MHRAGWRAGAAPRLRPRRKARRSWPLHSELLPVLLLLPSNRSNRQAYSTTSGTLLPDAAHRSPPFKPAPAVP